MKKRCVRLWADPDGMATISAYLSAEEAQAVWASLRAAAAGSTRRGMLPTRMRLWVDDRHRGGHPDSGHGVADQCR